MKVEQTKKIADDLEFWQHALTPNTVARVNKEFDAYLKRSPTSDSLRQAHLNCSTVAELATCPKISNFARERLNGEPQHARATIFCKNLKTNWFVPWHQDSVVAVSDKIHKDGWRNWRKKDMAYYAEAPESVLANTVIFRFHLSEANEDNGCTYVLPSTATHGRLNHDMIEMHTIQNDGVPCNGKAGDCWITRPLTLHRSLRSQSPIERRILHLEFCGEPLPDGITWAG